MKSTVLTTVSALVLTGIFAASTAKSGPEADAAGIDMMTTASLSSADAKGDRLPARMASFELAQADMPARPEDMAADRKPTDQVSSDTVANQDATGNVVDESALRYFARKGDKARLEAEITRLRSLHPDWTPPADPLAEPKYVDQELAQMWKLYSEGKYDEIRKAIATRMGTEPGWKAPADLMAKLAAGETRLTLVAASNDKRYDEVVDLAARAPTLLTCEDVDVLWRVADAFGRTARLPRAMDAYGYILDNCTKEPERLATVMKASALLDYGQMQTLLAKEKKAADGVGEFETIRDDLTRSFVGQGGINANLVVAPAYLDRLKALAARDGKASDSLLLGWYHIKRKQMVEAGPFFRRARDIEDSASASQGLALTLISAKNPKEAESVMYNWRNSSKEGWATYFAATANLMAVQPPPVLEPEVLARIAAAVTEKREIKTAENFGWYALAYKQPRTAAQWFRTTLGWKPDYEPAAYGLTIARLQLKDTAGVKQMQRLWGGRSQRIATITDTRRKRTELEDTVPSPDSVTPMFADPGIDDAATQSIDPNDGVDRSLTTRSIRKSVRAPVTEDDQSAMDMAMPDIDPITTQATQAIRVSTKRARTKGCGTSIDPARLSPNAAIDRGWCLMNLNRPIEAAAAFDVALRSSSAKIREDASYGQSLAYLRAGLVDQAAVSATKARQGVKRAVELQTSILADRALNAFGAGRPRETLIYLDQLAQLQTERADLMVLRAFAYKQLGRKTEAVRIFEALAAVGNRDAIKALGNIKQEEENVN
ncbi:cellulose synthase [Rhizobium sp.]